MKNAVYLAEILCGVTQMPSLQVREVPEQIYRRLKEEASRAHRSFAQQAIVTLARGLGLVEDPKRRRKLLLQNILETRMASNSDELADPVSLVREDRQR